MHGDLESSGKHVCGMTDIGLGRENNEDDFAILSDRNIYIVADGLGGHNAGEVASSEAIKVFKTYFTYDLINQTKKEPKKIKEQMESAFRVANKQIFEMSRENPDYKGMGCALIMAFIHDGLLHTCHAGDVRCYICNQSGILQLTNDHSEVGELIRVGKMTAEEAINNPLKNRLTQAVGTSLTISPGYQSYNLKDNDRILLCSDGLWDMLPDEEIRAVIMKIQNVSEICRELIKQANAAGGEDNITVIVYDKN